MTIDVAPGNATVEGAPFLSFARWGGFDGAELQMERAPMPSFGNTQAGTIIVFFGRLAEVDAGRTMITFTINSHLELLNQSMPRNLFQSSCCNTLFDSGCGLNKASFAVSGTVSGGTASSITAALSQATGYFDIGSIVFSSGANDGFMRTIKSYVHGTPSTVSLISPLPNTPVVGDEFTIYPGCDLMSSTCQTKFSNLGNFRGFPFIPDPTTAS